MENGNWYESWWLVIPVALLITGALIYFFKLRPKQKKQEAKDNRLKQPWERGIALKEFTRTPMGMEVRAEENAKQFVTPDALIACDAGITKGMEIASKCRGHAAPKTHADCVVVFFDAELAPKSQLPAYRVPAGQYAGTEFDMGGYVLAAGQVLSVGIPDGNLIGVPAPITRDFDYLTTGVYHEYEHIELAFFEPEYYKETETHGGGKGHPLFEDCRPQPARFIGLKPKAFVCGTDKPRGHV